jgi:hypothetical protein
MTGGFFFFANIFSLFTRLSLLTNDLSTDLSHDQSAGSA